MPIIRGTSLFTHMFYVPIDFPGGSPQPPRYCSLTVSPTTTTSTTPPTDHQAKSQQKSGQEGATHLPGGLSTLVDIQLCTTDHQANKSLEQGATHLRAAFQHWLIFYSAGMSLSGGFAYQRQNDG